jgi:hypothetical protein
MRLVDMSQLTSQLSIDGLIKALESLLEIVDCEIGV